MTGKGVFLGNKIYESACKKKGMIIIDPKKDDYAPAVANAVANTFKISFQVASWPNNFGYSGINEDDTHLEIANKLIDAFNLVESDNHGVEHYRKNARIALKKVLKIFFDGDLGIIVKKNLSEIVKHFQYLKTDLEKIEAYEKELSKNRPNNILIDKYEKRFFDSDLIDKIYWSESDIEAIDNIANTLSEVSDGAYIYNKIDIDEALYNGGIVYIKADLLDNASLKMIKILIVDIIQKARKKKANVDIYADEISFYANSGSGKTLSGALATTRNIGVKWSLFLQDLAQIEDGIREAILSNCNLKFFYKISDKQTLEYVSKIGGKELVSNFSASDGKSYGINQSTEDELNTTRIRALPRTNTAIVIAEALNKAEIVQTNFIEVKNVFDWSFYEYPKEKKLFDDIKKVANFKNIDIVNYRTKIKGRVKLLEDSDLFGYDFESNKIK